MGTSNLDATQVDQWIADDLEENGYSVRDAFYEGEGEASSGYYRNDYSEDEEPMCWLAYQHGVKSAKRNRQADMEAQAAYSDRWY